MATLNTEDELREILETNTIEDPKLRRYLNIANTHLTQVLSGESISSDLLKELECWYAAHLLASSILRQASEEKLGDAWVRYVGKTGEGLMSTTYGQMVAQLDPTGKIQKAVKQKISITAIKSFD